MPSILDAAPYPFWRPEAQQLHDGLARTFPTPQAADLVARTADVDTTMVFLHQPPAFVWKDILEAAAVSGRTRRLVRAARDRLSGGAPMRGFLEDLLADRATAIDSGSLDPTAPPPFVAADDEVTEPEALLYRDDLTMEIGRLPALIAALQHLVTLAPAVCKVSVTLPDEAKYGTAFRIGRDLLLTNWHVLHSRSDGSSAIGVTAEFGLDDNGRGGSLPSTAVACDAGTVLGDRADDWAVIRTSAPLRAEWPVLPVVVDATPTPGDPAFVIQHPLGQRKRAGIVRNQISYVDDRVVHYLTDTQVGSSGAPVFDASGRIIAVHHAGGRPQDVAGKPPFRKNEGIRAARIGAALVDRGVVLEP